MKKKVTIVDRANVRISTTDSGLTKIEVSDGYFGPVGWEFYVPKETRDHFGFIPDNIIRSRMMHDFKVQLGHYSITCCL